MIIHKLDLRRLPVGTAFVKLKRGLRQRALKTVHLQGELGASQQTARSAQAHLACGLDHVLALVKRQTPGLNAHARLAQAGLAFDDHVQIGAHAQILALDVNRPLLRLARRDDLFQQGAAAQDQTRQRGCGLGRHRGLGLRSTHHDTMHHEQHRPNHRPQMDRGHWGLRARNGEKGHGEGTGLEHARATGKGPVVGFVEWDYP